MNNIHLANVMQAGSDVVAAPNRGPRHAGNPAATSRQQTVDAVAAAQESSAAKQNEAALKELAQEVNESLRHVTSLRFQVDKELDNRVVVQVVDTDTEELIRQIPSENLLELTRRMRDLQGVLFDKKA